MSRYYCNLAHDDMVKVEEGFFAHEQWEEDEIWYTNTMRVVDAIELAEKYNQGEYHPDASMQITYLREGELFHVEESWDDETGQVTGLWINTKDGQQYIARQT